MINYKNINKLLLIIQVLLFLFLWIFTIIHFSELPEKIPQHYGFDGKPNVYGNKSMIWTMPIIGSLLFLLLNHVSKNTDSELLKISPKIKAKPELARTFVNAQLVFILFLFSRILFEEIKIIKGFQESLSFFVHTIIIVMLVSIVGFNTYYHYKK